MKWDEAANRIRSEVDEEAYIIFGSAFDGNLEGKVRVSVVATGIDANAAKRAAPLVLSALERPLPSMRPAVEPEPVSEPEIVEESSETAVIDEPLIPFRFNESESSETEEPVVDEMDEASEALMAETADGSVDEPVLVDEVEATDELEDVSGVEAKTVEDELAMVSESDPEPSSEIGLDSDVVAETPTDLTVETIETPATTDLDMPAVASAPEMDDANVPAGIPSADTKDAFIPPAPMTAAGGGAEKPSNPFAVTDMVNGSSVKPAVSSRGSGNRGQEVCLAASWGLEKMLQRKLQSLMFSRWTGRPKQIRQ